MSERFFKPGECQHERKVIDDKKCFCKIWDKWTNCREAGRCVYLVIGKPAENKVDQLRFEW